jgi:transposase
MQVKDARSLGSEAQETLRKRAVQAVLEGRTHEEVAQLFSVARGTVSRWMRLYRDQGESGLNARPKGRSPHPALKEGQAAIVVELVSCHSPDQLGLPFSLWTREAVGQLAKRRFGLKLSQWTVGRYLRGWGLTPQKPARRAYQQNPAAVRRWLSEEYPQVQRDAKEGGAEIHWGDEMGARSDHQAGRTWGRKGKTPVVGATGQRFRCSMISSLTNRGVLRFKVFEERFTAEVFIDFLQKPVRSRGGKVYLIVDRHPVHVSEAVALWAEKHQDRIRLIYLPAYSPELNPGEYLNQDVKANAVGRQRAKTKGQLMRNLRSYLRSTQKCPDVVRRFFHARPVHYAAA